MRQAELPQRVVEIEHTPIELSDGIRLAARIWMPEGADRDPVPAILEYIPYRKRDFTAERDAVNHPYLAAHGYACVRVDLRGSGDSEGVLEDEYLEQEIDDAEQVIRWLRGQPWCNGRVGMMGISWGGFNALQTAARRPVGLQAVVAVSASDDRYADDVHYMGGCLLGDNLSWAATMWAYSTLPPDPATVGESWRRMWGERLDRSGVWLDRWLAHQRRDAYWRHGSVCEDYADIEVPVLAVSGWADGYSNVVFRLLEHLRGPRLGLIGPWGHKYPHQGVPGPAIGFLQELVRWWDHWLKDEPTGIMDEPRLRVWLQDSVEPATAYAQRPGHWVGERSWPSPDVGTRHFGFQGYTLQEVTRPRDEAAGAVQDAPGAPLEGRTAGGEAGDRGIRLRSPLTLGEFAGKWCSFSALPQLPPDQRQEDGGALVFDSEPLEQPIEILGGPVVEVELASDRPVAMLAARLSDVRPDRATTRVSYGLLNLTHRDGHAEPTALEPGRRYRVRIRLNGTAQVLPRGHRLRIALSTSYWPLAWVPPEMATVTIFRDGCRLILPVRTSRATDLEGGIFGEPEGAAPEEVDVQREREHAWRVIRDLAEDRSTHEVLRDEGVRVLRSTGTAIRRTVTERYAIRHDRVDSASGRTEWRCALSRPASGGEPGWNVEVVTRMLLTSDAGHFYVDADIDAYDESRRIYARSHHHRIARDLV